MWLSLGLMGKRLESQGGIAQEDRMIKGKLETLKRALKYSYQGCDVTVDGENIYRALINPNKVKQDYDDKIISIPYDTKFKIGDVFEWLGTETKWLIYLQELTEDAYFRGHIRICHYTIKFKNEDNLICSTYAAIRGPIETQINSIQKNEIRLDQPNLSLNILVPFNKDNDFLFRRYNKFIFKEKCWIVNTYDNISMPGIIQATAEEYYIDREKDDIPNALADGLIIKEVDNNDNFIKGNTRIKPLIAEEYYVDYDETGEWCIKEDVPVSISIVSKNRIKLIWEKNISGQFTLVWKKDEVIKEKTIIAETLF